MYPVTSAVSDSPVEPSSCPTCRFRQEPGGEKQIGPWPCSCKWEGQQEDKGVLQPLLASASQHRTRAAPLIFEGPCTTKGQAQSHNIHVAGGSILLLSPQQGCRALGLDVGVAGCLTPLLQSLDFKATGEEKKKQPNKTDRLRNPSGARASRQCSPWKQVLLVLCDREDTAAQSNGYQLPKAEAGDWGEGKASEILT